MTSQEPVTLDYSRRQDKSGALPAYLGFAMGLSIASVIQWICTAWVGARGVPEIDRAHLLWLFRNSIITVIPGLLICAIIMLLRRHYIRKPQFARMHTGVLAGLISGVFPIFLLEKFQRDSAFAVIVVSIVLWNFMMPLCMGMFLCRGRRMDRTTGVTR